MIKSKEMAKTDKICIVCGEGFKGTAKAECCSPNCRKRLQRLKEAGKKPEFALVGGKNTKPVIRKKEPPKSQYKKPPAEEPNEVEEANTKSSGQPPDPKKDRAAWAKWMRNNK